MLIILSLLKVKPQTLIGVVYGQTVEAVAVMDVAENVLQENPAAIAVFPVIKNATNHQDVHAGDKDVTVSHSCTPINSLEKYHLLC